MSSANDADIRHVRSRTVALGELLLERWSEHRLADLEQIGPQPDRTFERAREMREGSGAKSTATTDRAGDPLLTHVERQADRIRTTLSVARWVDGLPREHQQVVRLFYVERRKVQQIASLIGVDRNHAGHMLDDAQYQIGRRMLESRGVNDPSHLERAA